MMLWFEKLTGFREESPEQVRASITLEGNKLKSLVNGKVLTWGELERPSLAELRERVLSVTGGQKGGQMSVREVVADVQELHSDKSNAGALFQVASQFNLLEMTGPDVTPEEGVGTYEYDHTQGPACAIAAGAGTIHRNYFAPVRGQTGQSSDNQIDCLADLGAALGNTDGRLWRMRNGYALPTESGLEEISQQILEANGGELDHLRELLRIGVQWETEVTLRNVGHTVTQAYCSALPVAYAPSLPTHRWTEFARLVLEAAYEATICAAILNLVRTGNNKVFLTLLGGGAFGNQTDWIVAAVRRALELYRHAELNVAIVSHGSSKSYVRQLISQIDLS
jgi:hypothetical protein